ncbi:MAG: hypothetical protein U0Z53_26055 [Blastocatellia bacterium]
MTSKDRLIFNEYRACQLAGSFPSLRQAPGIQPWEPARLDAWAETQNDPGTVYAARFVLEVWNQHQEWQCGRFSISDAMYVWDEAHREAFRQWARCPYRFYGDSDARPGTQTILRILMIENAGNVVSSL